jgi:hypothetical protein
MSILGRFKYLLFLISNIPALGTPDLPSGGYFGLSPGVKRLWHEANHSLRNSADVKETLIHTSTPPKQTP